MGNEEQTNKEETDISEILRNLNLEMQLVGNTSNNETSDSVNRNFNENSDDSNSTFSENQNQISQNFTDNSNNKNNNAKENFMSSSVRKVLNSTKTEISENQKLTKIKESNSEQNNNKNNTNIKKNNQETSETIITSSVTNSAMSNKIDNIIDKNAGLEFNFNVPSALPTKEGWQGNDIFVTNEKKIDGMADKIVEVFGPGIDLVSDELLDPEPTNISPKNQLMEESKLITNLTKTMIDDSTSKIEPISDDNQNENNSHSGILDENLETEMELEETNLEAFSANYPPNIQSSDKLNNNITVRPANDEILEIMVQTANETKTKYNNSQLNKIQFEDQRTSLTIQSSKSNLKMLNSSPVPVIPVAENVDVSSKNINNNQTSIESFYGLQIPSDKLNLVIAACAAGVIIGTIITSLLCLCCCRIIKRRRAGGLRQRSIKTTEISLTKKPKMLAPPTNMLTPDKRNKKDDSDDNSSKLRLKIGNRTRKESKKQKDTLDRNINNNDDYKSNVTEALLKNSGSGLTFHHNNHNTNPKTHNSTSDNRGETFEHLNFGNHSTIQTNAGHENVFLEGGIGERSRLLQNNSSIISSSQNQMIPHPNHNGAFMSVSSTGHQISAHPIAANRYSLSGTPNQLVNPSTSSQHSSLGRNMTFSAGAVNNNNNPSPNWTNYSHFNPSHNISQFPTLH